VVVASTGLFSSFRGWNKKTSFGSVGSKQVRFIPVVDKRAGVQTKLCDPLTTRAIPERFCDEVSS